MKKRVIYQVLLFFLIIFIKTYSEENQYLIEAFPILTFSKYHVSINSDYTVQNQKHRLLKKKEILSKIKQVDEKSIFEYNIFALGRFIIDSEYDGYLIEEIPDRNAEHKIYCLVLDKTNNYFIQVIEIASSYGYEGTWSEKECYIYDLNNDKYLDLIITGYTHSIIPGRVINNKRMKDDIIISLKDKILFFDLKRFRDSFGNIHLED